MIVEQTNKVWHSSAWVNGEVSTRELTTSLRRTYSDDGCEEILTGPEGRSIRRVNLGPPAASPQPLAAPEEESIAAPARLDQVAPAFGEKIGSLLHDSGLPAGKVVAREDLMLTSWSSGADGETVLGPRPEHHFYFGAQCVAGDGTRLLASRHAAGQVEPDRDPDIAVGMAAEIEARRHHLGCRALPAGDYPVVLAQGASGLFAHECLGHLLEVDLAESALVRRLGQPISPDVPFDLYDEPTSAYLSIPWDDEGVGTSVARLVSDGVVTGLISDRSRGETNGFGRLTTTGIRPRMRNLRLRGSGPAEFEPPLHYVRPILPIRAGCRGTRFAMLFGGGLVVRGDQESKVGPLVVSGTVIETLKGICFVGRAGQWLTDGGMCGKGGGEALFVGAWGPDVILGSMRCAGVDLNRLAARPTRLEDMGD